MRFFQNQWDKYPKKWHLIENTGIFGKFQKRKIPELGIIAKPHLFRRLNEKFWLKAIYFLVMVATGQKSALNLLSANKSD